MQAVRHLRGPPSTSLPGPGLGAWPRERRASSPEQPGCSPVGERLGQSQFLYWALDGTDGRKFKGSQPAIRGVFGQGGPPVVQRAWMCCQQQHPTGVSPSTACPPCHCPAAFPPHPILSCPAKGSPVLHRSRTALQGPWPPTMPLSPGHDLCYSSPSAGSPPRARKHLVRGVALYSAQTASKREGKSSLGSTGLFHCEAAPRASAHRIRNTTRHQGVRGETPRAGSVPVLVLGPHQRSLWVRGRSGEWHPGTFPLSCGMMVQRDALGHCSYKHLSQGKLL